MLHFNHKMIVPMFEDAMDTGGGKKLELTEEIHR